MAKEKKPNATNAELVEYLKNKYSKDADKRETLDQMNRQRVKNVISSLCEKYLTESGQVFAFEVMPKDLPAAIVVIDEEPLKSMYDISQVSETVFNASLKELEF